MFKLPDGKEIPITSAKALALVFTTNQEATKSWLAGTLEMLTHNPEKDAKDIIRGKEKDKGEQYAPFVAALMGQGMAEASAKTRWSELRTVYYGWTHGEAEKIAHANGWIPAVDIARRRKDADTNESKRVKVRNAVAVLRADLEEQQGLDPNAAKAVAVQTYEQTVAEETVQATFNRLEKAANKMGFSLFPLQYTTDNIVQLAINSGTLEQVREAINVAIEQRNKELAERQAADAEAAKGAKAAIVNERQTHKVTAIPAMEHKETETQ